MAITRRWNMDTRLFQEIIKYKIFTTRMKKIAIYAADAILIEII
jgi:hypothetical protein